MSRLFASPARTGKPAAHPTPARAEPRAPPMSSVAEAVAFHPFDRVSGGRLDSTTSAGFPPLTVTTPDDPSEREADRIADAVMSGGAAAQVSAIPLTPRLQRQVEKDQPTALDRDPEATTEAEDDEDENGREPTEEDAPAGLESEPPGADSGTTRSSQPGSTAKPKFRRKRHHGGPFSGIGTNVFGGKRGKILRTWGWSWGKIKTKGTPATETSRSITLTSLDSDQISITGDSLSPLGGAFYAGESIAGLIEVPGFERRAAVSAPPPVPGRALNETISAVTSTQVVTATLQYRFGDVSDPVPGPRAQAVVEAFVGGTWIRVFTTNLVSTGGTWQTATLPGLMPETTYRVRIWAEYWDLNSQPGPQWYDPRTTVDYSFQIQEVSTTQATITRKRPGKRVIVKDKKRLRLRL